MHNTRTPRAFMRALVIAAAAAGLSAASAQTIDVTGHQRPSDDVTTVQVVYGDLDLNQAPDRSQMDRRIRFAARTVCGSPPLKRLDARNDNMACRIAAIDGANAQLHAVTQTMVAGGAGGD